MALSRSKTWSSAEVLTASELNGEFNNILNNAASLISTIALVFNEDSADLDFRIEGANNTNLFTLDAGQDAIGLGTGVLTGTFMSITAGAQARAIATSIGMALHITADIYTDTDSASGTNAIGSTVHIGIGTYADSGGNFRNY